MIGYTDCALRPLAAAFSPAFAAILKRSPQPAKLALVSLGILSSHEIND
jgi:hypothetical protein